jgi:hypothetical protein
MNKELTKEEMINSERVLNELGIWQKEVIARVMQNFAEQETERLKGIIEKIIKENRFYKPTLSQEKAWEQFKIENNL